jgi:nucleoside 2-deoxyribosyltransferase
LKFYFAGSIRGGREDAELYQQIILCLKEFGEVLTEHIGDPNLTIDGDDGPTDRFIHDRDMEWLFSSDVIVAEITVLSMGVGYEIGRAVEMGKRVICLYRNQGGKKLSAMIAGCPNIKMFQYSDPEELFAFIKKEFHQ